MKNYRLSVLASLLALGFTAASAAPQTFDFKDPKGVNTIRFTLDAPLETISGTANGVSGMVTFDPEAPQTLTGTILLDAKTLTVPNPVMQEHMHSAGWLDTEKYPEASFSATSVSIEKSSGETMEGTITGQLTLRGVTREVSAPLRLVFLPGKVAERSNGQAKGDLLVIRSEFTVNRGDFGIKPGQNTDKVSEEVRISLALAGAAYHP